MGNLPLESGLSWLGVVTISSLPSLQMSQPQPEPNCLAVFSLNCFLNSFEGAEVLLDLVADGAGGLAAAVRLHDLPEHAVVHVAAAVVAHHGADILGNGGEIFEQVFRGVLAQVGVLLDCAIELADVGGVVLVVMQLHGGFVDVWLESGVVVG